QTVHDETARRVHRGYPLSTFREGYRKLKAAGIPVIVHVIFGLPGESREDMLDTVRYLAALAPPPDGVKLQMLHVLKGTALGEQYQAEPFPLLSLEEYAALVAEAVAILPEETVVHRLTGDGPGPLLLAPDWTRNKKRVLNTINARIRETDSGR
ncbi:MAG: radical SAM protein, partial [Oscillospiraceae bacterium]|nr:radical SAM protein [Oscillospiraceae bacterium]